MTFEKIKSTITIVPFISNYIDKEDTIAYRISQLYSSIDKKRIIGYYDCDLGDSTGILRIFNDEWYYTELVSKFINDKLLKDTRYKKFVIFNGDVSNTSINSIMAELINQDTFEIEKIDIYNYTILSAVKEPLYISYVSSFDTD